MGESNPKYSTKKHQPDPSLGDGGGVKSQTGVGGGCLHSGGEFRLHPFMALILDRKPFSTDTPPGVVNLQQNVWGGKSW